MTSAMQVTLHWQYGGWTNEQSAVYLLSAKVSADFYELSKSIFTSFLSCRNAVINKRLPILYNSKGT